jgi:hypothetical protein
MDTHRGRLPAHPLDVPPAVRTHRLDYWTWVAEHAVPASRDILC